MGYREAGSTTNASALPRPGMVVGGKFALLRLLGEGGVGAVYEAEDTWIGRRVAIKLLHPHFAKNAEVMWRFRREARAAASIEHPNIVSVYELGQRRDGSSYIVQELLDGYNLRTHVEERGQLPSQEVLNIFVPIAGALVAAHRKDVIHRDIKPENIILSSSSTGETVPKIIDFGIARMTTGAGDGDTQTGSFLGTLEYMSPEQLNGAETVDGRTDVWAIGAVMFELLAGASPFDAPTPEAVMKKILVDPPPRLPGGGVVPAALSDVVHRALDPDLGRRYPSMEALLIALLDVGARLDPSLPVRHGRSIPRPSQHRIRVGSGELVETEDTVLNAKPLTDLVEVDEGDWEEISSIDILVEEARPRRTNTARPVALPDLERHDELPSAPVRDAEWHARLAEEAIRENALDDALDHARRAITLRTPTDELVGRMSLVQAIAHRWLGHFPEAEACAAETARLLPERSTGWYAAMGHLALVCGYSGKNEKLVELADTLARVEAGSRASGAHVVTACRLAISLMRAGSPEIAHRVFGTARTASEEPINDEPVVRAWVDLTVAEFAVHAGEPTQHLRLLESAIGCFAEAGDARNASLQRANIGNAYMQLGAYVDAERVLREAVSVGEPMKLHFIAPVRANLGMVLGRLGHLREALEVETAALDQCVQQGYRRFEAAARIYLSFILSQLGRTEEAEAQAKHAIAASASGPALRAHALASLAGLLLKRKEARQALARAREAMDILESLEGVDEGESSIRLAYVRALEATDWPVEARAKLVEARDRLLRRAERIRDETWRRSFLENIAENAETLAMAAKTAG